MNVSEVRPLRRTILRCERLSEHVPAAASATALGRDFAPGEDRA